MVNHPSLIAWSLFPKDLSKVVVSDDGLDYALTPFKAERTTPTGKRKPGGSTAEMGAGGREVTMMAGSNGMMTYPPEPLSAESRAEPPGPSEGINPGDGERFLSQRVPGDIPSCIGCGLFAIFVKLHTTNKCLKK